MDRIFRTPIKQVAPISDPKHLVTWEFLEQKMAGLIWDAVDAATDSGLGGTGTATTLTAAADGVLPQIDGISLALGNRVLVKDQADKSQNGIYEVTDLGSVSSPWVLTRAEDADTNDEFRPDKRVYVLPGGSVNGNFSFKQVTATAVVLGTSSIDFGPAEDVTYARTETVEFTGDNSTKDITVTHTLNTENVIVAVKNKNTKAFEDFGVKILGATTVQVSSDPALTTSDTYLVTLVGQPEA
jgi:hypothetical protein